MGPSQPLTVSVTRSILASFAASPFLFFVTEEKLEEQRKKEGSDCLFLLSFFVPPIIPVFYLIELKDLGG